MKNFKCSVIIAIIAAFAICGLYTQSTCFASDNTNSNYQQTSDKNLDMEQYVRLTRKRIKMNWYPPTSSFENTATISLTVNREGKLVDCHLSIPSKDEGFNNSLIEAAKKTTYSPLPKEFPGNSAVLDLDFSMQRRTISK